MSITAHGRTGGDTGAMGRFPMLASPLGALLYPLALEGFNTSVTRIAAGAYTLSWLGAAGGLSLALPVPLIAVLPALVFFPVRHPPFGPVRPKTAALLRAPARRLF